MKILVCISNVPDTTTKVTFTNNNTQFNTGGVQFIINPYDDIALARALELTDGAQGTVTVIHVGDTAAEATLRKALSIGATDAVRINAEPKDAYFVAAQLAEYLKQNPYDLILTGRESIDYNGSRVADMLGELLDLPSVLAAKKLDVADNTATVEREMEGGKEILTLPMPFIAAAAEGLAEPKIPNMRGIMSARSKPIKVVEPVAVSGLATITAYQTPEPRSKVRMLQPQESAELIGLLHTEAKVI